MHKLNGIVKNNLGNVSRIEATSEWRFKNSGMLCIYRKSAGCFSRLFENPKLLIQNNICGILNNLLNLINFNLIDSINYL